MGGGVASQAAAPSPPDVIISTQPGRRVSRPTGHWISQSQSLKSPSWKFTTRLARPFVSLHWLLSLIDLIGWYITALTLNLRSSAV